MVIGSRENPVQALVVEPGRAEKVVALCKEYKLYLVLGFAQSEDLSQLAQALEYRLGEDPYANCICGSGEKFKFCCSKTGIDIQKILEA